MANLEKKPPEGNNLSSNMALFIDAQLNEISPPGGGKEADMRKISQRRVLLESVIAKARKTAELPEALDAKLAEVDRQKIMLVDPFEEGKIVILSKLHGAPIRKRTMQDMLAAAEGNLGGFIESGGDASDLGAQQHEAPRNADDQLSIVKAARSVIDSEKGETVSMDDSFLTSFLILASRLNDWRVRGLLGDEKGLGYIEARKDAINAYADMSKRINQRLELR